MTHRICFFGTYDRNFTSNQIVLKGLQQNGVEVAEVNAHVPVTPLDQKEHMGWFPLIKRVVKKYRIFAEIWKKIPEIRKCQSIYVGYPGHFDVLFAFPLAKIFRLKLIFNPLVIFYTGYVEDQTILEKKSLMGITIKNGEKFIYNLCDLVLADTPLQKQHLIKEFGLSSEKISVLPIGADDEIYPFSPLKEHKKFFVAYYGLYTPLHGVEHIINAARILEKHKNIQFLMIGKGNTFEKNYKMAQEYGLKNITFYPNMTESNALATLQKSDAFLGFLQRHPSVERIIPNKVYQGLSLGKVVISANAKVIRSIFTDGKNIILCEQSNFEDLAKKILYLSKSPKQCKKIAKAGHDLFTKNFTPAAIGQQLLKQIERII